MTVLTGRARASLTPFEMFKVHAACSPDVSFPAHSAESVNVHQSFDCPLRISTHSWCVSASTESHSHFRSSPAYTFSHLVCIYSHLHPRSHPLCVSAHRKCISPFQHNPPASHCTLALGDSNCIGYMSTDKWDSSLITNL